MRSISWIAAGALFAAGCGANRDGSVPPVARPNLVVISVDSLRPDHLGAYGYDRETSPAFDRLAGGATLFERAWSTTTWTLPSHLSLLTGLTPDEHGVHGHGHRLSESAALVSELLRPAGYRCEAIVSGAFLHRRYGYDQGWERWDDELAFESEATHAYGEVTSERVHAKAVAALDRLAPGPFLLFLHYFDVHYDYIAPPPYDRMFDPDYAGGEDGRRFVARTLRRREMPARDLAHLVALYDGEIRWVDDWLGKLFDELAQRGLAERTLIAVTSDHGDEFLEHGRFGHSNNLLDVTLRVPLVVRFPGGAGAGRRLATPVGLVDLAPTLLAAAGVAPPAAMRGVDLARLAAGTARPERGSPLFAGLFRNRYAVVHDGWKALVVRESGRIVSGKTRLFDLARDPGERRNVARELRATRVRALHGELVRYLERASEVEAAIAAPRVESDPEFNARLRALGYL